MAKPDLTQKQYVALKGCKCPNCGSEQCEQAAYLYTFDTTLLEDSLQGLSRQAINVSGVSISQTIRPKGSMLCAEAYNYVKYLLINQCMRLQRA